MTKLLIDIKLRDNYVEDTIKERQTILKNSQCGELQRLYLTESIRNLRNIKSINDIFTKCDVGIYRGEVYEGYLTKVTGKDFSLYVTGKAPTIEAIINQHIEIKNSHNKYVIIFKYCESNKLMYNIFGLNECIDNKLVS